MRRKMKRQMENCVERERESEVVQDVKNIDRSDRQRLSTGLVLSSQLKCAFTVGKMCSICFQIESRFN